MGEALPSALRALVEALLIGFLVGAQREASHGERHAGVRDFILIALTGAVCGLLQNAWLTAAALISTTLLLVVYYFHIEERSGITTEMAAVATFCLSFLIATPDNPLGEPLAIGMAIIVVAFLEAKQSLHKLVRETITETEFNDTLRFLAIIFVIYPVLPDRGFGPYHFFVPRQVWLFVILISSISYVGYFFQKFLGVSRGLKFAGLFGGLASTTAATIAFARNSSENPSAERLYAQATVVANAMQFPRVLAILLVVSPELAQVSALPLLAMGAVGLLVGLLPGRKSQPETTPQTVPLGNPFRLAPALKFGAIFATILFATKAAAATFGSAGVYWTSGIAGLLDADSVSVSVADLLSGGQISLDAGILCVFLAVLMNAVFKTAIAVYAGKTSFASRVAVGFVVMLGVGIAVWVAIHGA